MAKCGDADWPVIVNGMCCNKDKDPVELAGGTTLLCCPHGADCTIIEPLSCNLTLYNPHPVGLNPPNVSTIYTDGELPPCGLGCCAWGYNCNESEHSFDVCVMDDDQSYQPDGEPAISTISTSTSTSSASTAVSISTSGLSSTFSSATLAISTTKTEDQQTTQSAIASVKPVEGAAAGGLGKHAIAGIAIGAFAFVALAGGVVYLLWRLRQQRKANSGNNNTGSNISTVNSPNTEPNSAGPQPSTATTSDEPEKAAELPAPSRVIELDNTQVERGPVYELE
ncbi:hypothetical protein F4861DRAFT_181199 [Xylaria intraflava]|nr:hypothetical protein F4861DRAFT_181199 [Xylaria intraflava]